MMKMTKKHKDGLYNYIIKNFNISPEAARLIDNILCFVEENIEEMYQYDVLCDFLETIGLEREEIRKVCVD